MPHTINIENDRNRITNDTLGVGSSESGWQCDGVTEVLGRGKAGTGGIVSVPPVFGAVPWQPQASGMPLPCYAGAEEICAWNESHLFSGISFLFIWASGGILFVILLVVNLGGFFQLSFKYSDQVGSQLFC